MGSDTVGAKPGLVSFPDPPRTRGKGIGTLMLISLFCKLSNHVIICIGLFSLIPPSKEEKGLVHIKHFLGLVSEYNQIHAMWLTCDYHVTPRYSQLLLRERAVNCQNDALIWQSHDMLCAPKSAQCVPDPFPPRVWDETNVCIGARAVK